MAKYEDYIEKPQQADGIDDEIKDAKEQQTARQEASTQTDWEQRYKELEKLNSRQAQTLGEYRKTIDEFIASPTSANASQEEQESQTISEDDYYSDPLGAVNKTVDSHPAIREAKKLKEQIEQDQRQKQVDEFKARHPDFSDIASSPEFQNWIVEDTFRVDLYSRANQYDFSAADALFRLYKAEQGMAQVQNQQDISQAELVSSSGEMVQEPPKYSRSEYINKLQRARQGDLDAEDWVKRNAAGYRKALESGNVRD